MPKIDIQAVYSIKTNVIWSRRLDPFETSYCVLLRCHVTSIVMSHILHGQDRPYRLLQRYTAFSSSIFSMRVVLSVQQ